MKMQKILFITLSNIGDVILTLPVLSGLKYNFPDAIIDVVVGPRPHEVFKKDPKIRNIYIYDKQAGLKEKIKLIKILRSERYDLTVDMRTSLIPFLIGAKKRHLLVSRHRPRRRHKHAVHLAKLEGLGIKSKTGPSLYIDDSDRKRMQVLLKDRGCDSNAIIIGISPSTRGILKQWDANGFISIIQGLLKKDNVRIILIGDSNQIDTSKKIKDSVKSNALIDLTGEINLNELFALIERIQVLVTGDSAALHIASDLGIKTVALFGPTDPEEYGPRGKDDVVIRKKLKCSPCRKATCAFNHECMKEIKPQEVLEAIESLSIRG